METINIYNKPNEFWNAVSSQLKIEEVRNNLLLGVSYIGISMPSDCLYQCASFENNKLQGALVCSKYRDNNNLLLSPIKSISTAKLLLNNFIKANISISSIIADAETIGIYSKLFTEYNIETKLLVQQGIYSCNKVNQPNRDDLTFELASDVDIELIGGWIESFHNEATPEDPKVDGLMVAKEKILQQMIYVSKKNHDIVTMAGWSRDIGTSCSINLVFTPQEQRNNGYASYTVAKLTDQLLKQGRNEITLYTDMSNPTSNKIYMHLGYKFICNSLHLAVIGSKSK